MSRLLTDDAHLLVSEWMQLTSKAFAKEALRCAAHQLASEDRWESMSSKFIWGDEDGKEWMICLVLHIHTLREEIAAWSQPHGPWSAMTWEERARADLIQFATRLKRDPDVAPLIDVIRNICASSNECWLDPLSDLLFNIHNMHEQLAAWAERREVAS